MQRLRGNHIRKQILALDDISLSIEQGEVVGIIGHNGAGKSTLLKLLANITRPSTGSLSITGKVAPLIEVGAGLVSDLTGRENIYLNGTILGIRKAEITRKFDEIVAFAELEEFIDTPIKRYSSGMQVRLGFAIATSVSSDILIVDEVLAVGDLAFQRKCFERMESLILKEGRTVLIVGHNVRQMERICSRMIVLDHGRIVFDGAPAEATQRYYLEASRKARQATQQYANVSSSGEVLVRAVEVVGLDGTAASVRPRYPACFRVCMDVRQALPDVTLSLGVLTTDFVYAFKLSTEYLPVRPDLVPGEVVFNCHVDNLPLKPGCYAVRLIISDRFGRVVWYADSAGRMDVGLPLGGDPRLTPEGIIEVPCRWAVAQGTDLACTYPKNSGSQDHA